MSSPFGTVIIAVQAYRSAHSPAISATHLSTVRNSFASRRAPKLLRNRISSSRLVKNGSRLFPFFLQAPRKPSGFAARLTNLHSRRRLLLLRKKSTVGL